jgi:hypothetical protein
MQQLTRLLSLLLFLSQPNYTGREAWDAYIAQKNPGGGKKAQNVLYRALWKEMRTESVASRAKQPSANARFKGQICKMYKSVIEPFEKEMHFEAIRVVGSQRRRSSTLDAELAPHNDDEDEWANDLPAPAVDIDTARTDLQRHLESMRDTILPQMMGSHQNEGPLFALKQLQDAIDASLRRVENEGSQDWSSLRRVPVVGKAGAGKSHLLNILLAITEADKFTYNRDRACGDTWDDKAAPGAVHAARIAVMLVHRDVADETDLNDAVLACMDVGDGECLEDDGARRCMASATNDRVIHELPSSKIFDKQGYLNPDFEDVGAAGEVKT